jgi:DNA-binding response OmpR family regulator
MATHAEKDVRKRVLVIEDDEDIALSLEYNLEKAGGYVVQSVRDGESGLKRALERPPDLVILDLNLPGMDGLAVCQALRRHSSTAAVPIMMLTARVEESDRIVGLEIGADDYLTKPFSMREILARIRALLRRAERRPDVDAVYSDGVILLDRQGHILKVQDRDVTLTRKEFDLLATLVGSRGRVLTREQLLERVWGPGYYGESRTVDVHVRRVRKKLGKEAQDCIETIVGVGYRFRPAARSAG